MTSWITAGQRMAFVHRVTKEADANDRAASTRPDADSQLAGVAASARRSEES